MTILEHPQITEDTPDNAPARVPTAKEINLEAQARAKRISSDSAAPLDKRLEATRDAAFFGRMAEQPSEDEMRADMAAKPTRIESAKKLASQLLQNRFSRR